MTNVNSKIEDMILSLGDIFNYGQLDNPNKETTFDGKTNPKYNSDIVYMFGGIISQIAWSLNQKKPYADANQAKWIQEKENNPDNPNPDIQERHEQSLGAMENLHALYEFNVQCFNTFSTWTWNNGKSTDDYGMKWYAEHRDQISDSRSFGKTSSPEDKKKALLENRDRYIKRIKAKQ